MRILFTITGDIDYDQRMIRISNSLVNNGYTVKLIGAQKIAVSLSKNEIYITKRLSVFFKKGFAFYFEYNLRLFVYLLFQKTDILCCIDLDTILPVYFAALIKNKIKVYDAHEYFSQQKEIIRRPKIYRVWHFIESHFVPKFTNGYTVSEGIADKLFGKYGVKYEVIMNTPLLKRYPATETKKETTIIYRGSVNEGRGFEYLLPAMKKVDATLLIYGDGNFLNQAKSLTEELHLQSKVFFKGKFFPDELEKITQQAYIGINLVEPFGQNQILSLANKFFDYMHHAIPQLTMNFPEYKKINDQYEIAILIDELSAEIIADALNILLNNKTLYLRLKQNCIKAREVFNWQNEENKLLNFYQQLSKK